VAPYRFRLIAGCIALTLTLQLCCSMVYAWRHFGGLCVFRPRPCGSGDPPPPRSLPLQVDYNEETDEAAIIEMGEELGRPSHTVVGVRALAFAGMRVEVEVTAVVPAAKLAELRHCRA